MNSGISIPLLSNQSVPKTLSDDSDIVSDGLPASKAPLMVEIGDGSLDAEPTKQCSTRPELGNVDPGVDDHSSSLIGGSASDEIVFTNGKPEM